MSEKGTLKLNLKSPPILLQKKLEVVRVKNDQVSPEFKEKEDKLLANASEEERQAIVSARLKRQREEYKEVLKCYRQNILSVSVYQQSLL